MQPAFERVEFPGPREAPPLPALPETWPNARAWMRLAAPVLALTGLTLLHVYERRVSVVSLVAWLTAVVLAVYACCRGERRRVPLSLRPADRLLLVIALLFALDQLWRFSADPGHYHIDEFITAHTSYALADAVRLDWFADFPDGWVCRFPALFHVLQRPFFLALGPSLETLRLSTWPYYIAIAGYVYALGALVFSRRAGIASALLWMFLGANLYLASMGLHFISSTCFFVAALYHFLAALSVRSRRHGALAGMFTACSYLTYAGSYVAGPVLALIGLAALTGAWRRRRLEARSGETRRAVTPVLASSVAVFLVTFAPFLLFAFHVDNFLFQRVRQVNAISGQWVLANGAIPDVTLRVQKQAWDALRSVVVPGLSGNTGYSFGGQALLDRVTAGALVLGILVCLWRLARRRTLGELGVLIALVLPFVTNGVLTDQPTPFHRISVMFPLIALVAAAPLGLAADRMAARARTLGVLALFVPLAGLVYWNVGHARLMARSGQESHFSTALARWLGRELRPGDTFYVGVSWSMHVAPELLFRTGGRFRVVADNVERILDHYEGRGPIVLFGPSIVPAVEELGARFPQHEVLREIDGLALQDTAVFVPRSTGAPAAKPMPVAKARPARRNVFTGTCGSEPGQLRSPRGIAVAANGDIFIADSDNHRIQRFSARGEYRSHFGSQGHGPDQMNVPSGIAIGGDGHVYVSDAWNHRVLKITGKGRPVAQWKPGLFAPFGVAVTDAHEILVADTGNGRVALLAADGSVRGRWGKRGRERGELWDHTGVASNGDRVYVADPLNGRIQVFPRDGTEPAVWPVTEWSGATWRWAHLVVDSRRGRVYASAPQTSAVIVFDIGGRRLQTLPVIDDGGLPLKDATALALSANRQELLVVDTTGCRLGRAALP